MEAVLLVYENGQFADANFGPCLDTYQNKIQRLLDDSKFMPVLVWEADNNGQYQLRKQLYGSLRTKIEGPVSISGLVEAVLHCFQSGASFKNPGFVKIYSACNLVPFPDLLASKFVQSITVSVKPEEADFGLEKMLRNEIKPVSIRDIAQFSLLAYPDLWDLHLWACAPIESTCSHSEKPLSPMALDAAYRLTDLESEAWILEISKEVASIYRENPADAHFDPLASLGYKAPKIVNQLYNIVLMLNTSNDLEDSTSLQTLKLLLDSFVASANTNDSSLFPKIADFPELRARAVFKSVKELKKVSISNPGLKKIITEKLSKFDSKRMITQAVPKKPKLDAKRLNEPASEFSKFRKLVPYQELSYPSQRDGPPGNPPKNSLLTVFWKMYTATIEDPRLCGKKYWE